MKSKRSTVWIVLTCVLAVLVFVLAAALYHSWQVTVKLQTQLADAQNDMWAEEVVQGQQETATAGSMQTVRVMNGILQQQDGSGQWVDIAPVEELQQDDPVLAGRSKMQELIAQNREAVQNGTASAEQISPFFAKQSILAGAALASASQVQSATEKTAPQTVKPANNTTTTVAPEATPVPTQQPTINDDNNDNDDSDDSSSDSGSSDSGNSDNSSSDNGSSDNGSSDNGSSDSGSSDSGADDSGASDDSSDSGDGEDVGWTDEVL